MRRSYGEAYSGKQVIEGLQRFSDDTARIRRALIDQGFMRRTTDVARDWRVDGSP